MQFRETGSYLNVFPLLPSRQKRGSQRFLRWGVKLVQDRGKDKQLSLCIVYFNPASQVLEILLAFELS